MEPSFLPELAINILIRLTLWDSTNLEYFSQAIHCPLGCPSHHPSRRGTWPMQPFFNSSKMQAPQRSGQPLGRFEAQTKLPRIDAKRCKIKLDSVQELNPSTRPCWLATGAPLFAVSADQGEGRGAIWRFPRIRVRERGWQKDSTPNSPQSSPSTWRLQSDILSSH